MKMHNLNSICFICLNNYSGFKTHLKNDTQNDTVTEVKYVLPELTILDPDISLYICYSCYSTIHSFYTFKKKCLENYSRLKRRINNSHESTRKSEQEVNIKLEFTEEIEDVSQSWEEQDDQETEVDDSIDIKEELIVSPDVEYSQQLEFVKCEPVSDSEQDGSSNSLNEDPVDFSTHTNNFAIYIGSKTKYECYICNKNFTQKGNLKSHIKIHTGIQDFKCFICNKKFTQHNTLQVHMKIHDGIKDFICCICNNKFTQRNTLQRHMKIHDDTKEFKCSICSKEFIRKGDFQRHMKMHDGIKDFKCSVCDKEFIRKGDLQSHMKIHNGIKEFKCTICNKEFTRKSNLNVHMKNHKNIKEFECS